MRWIVGILLAAVAGGAVYALGLGSEAAYIARSITRHVVGYH